MGSGLRGEGAKLWRESMQFEQIQVWRNCVRRDPSCVEAYLRLGRLLEKTGDITGAQDVYAVGLRETGGNSKIIAQLRAIRDLPDTAPPPGEKPAPEDEGG